MAPNSPVMMTVAVICSTCIIPEPIIFATFVPKANAATKLKNAAQMTASFGDSTRVDTSVAMLLAASWNPLMKSNASATRMVTITRRVVLLTLFALAQHSLGQGGESQADFSTTDSSTFAASSALSVAVSRTSSNSFTLISE